MPNKNLTESQIEALEALDQVQSEISALADLLLVFTDKGNAEIKNSTLHRIGEQLDDCNLKLNAVHNKIIAA